MGAPLGEKNILAIDPGFRSGCKVVCLSAQGGLEYNETIYPHAPKNDSLGAMKKINSLVDAYKIEAIAIGNGTASHQSAICINASSNRESAVFVNQLSIMSIPTSAAGLPSGAVWRNGTVLNIVP